MTDAERDAAWTSAVIAAARPQAIAALLRYFRDLDTAEEAFQEACLRALSSWPERAAAQRGRLAHHGRPERRHRRRPPP